MNNFSKGLVIFSLIIVILGFGMLIAGFTLGGNLNEFNLGVENSMDINETYNNVNELELDLKFGDIQIKDGDTFRIEGSVPDNIKFETNVKDGKWTIKDDSKIGTISIFGFPVSKYNYNVTIYIPSNNKLNKVKIDVGACKLQAETLNSKDIDINVGAGELTVNKLISDSNKIDCGVGKVQINSATFNNSNVKCGVGDITMKVDGNQNNYNYEIDTGIGNVNIGDNSYSGIGSNKRIKNNNTDNLLKVDCGVGNVTVNFEEE